MRVSICEEDNINQYMRNGKDIESIETESLKGVWWMKLIPIKLSVTNCFLIKTG